MRPLLLLALLPAAAAHGQLVNPRSRNSIDYLLNMTDCTPPTPDGDPCIHNCSNLTGAPCVNGQASYWYSQGCFIGCPECRAPPPSPASPAATSLLTITVMPAAGATT